MEKCSHVYLNCPQWVFSMTYSIKYLEGTLLWKLSNWQSFKRTISLRIKNNSVKWKTRHKHPKGFKKTLLFFDILQLISLKLHKRLKPHTPRARLQLLKSIQVNTTILIWPLKSIQPRTFNTKLTLCQCHGTRGQKVTQIEIILKRLQVLDRGRGRLYFCFIPKTLPPNYLPC